MKKTLIGSLTAIVLFNSCLKSHDSQPVCDPNYNPCALVAPASEVTAVENYISQKGITNAFKHCSGMYFAIDSAGSGKAATVCSNVYIEYKGELTNGNGIDSTSGGPAYFNVSGLLPSFKDAIPLIREGGGMHLYIPPTLGYGSQQVGTIPANSILIFQLKLVAVQ